MRVCPHSDLPTYPTVNHARIGIQKMVYAHGHATFYDFRVHDCSCGRFHVTSTICPTPTKKSYLSRAAAAAQVAKSAPGRARSQYRCACGFWHLTSQGALNEKSNQL